MVEPGIKGVDGTVNESIQSTSASGSTSNNSVRSNSNDCNTNSKSISSPLYTFFTFHFALENKIFYNYAVSL